MKLPLKIGQKDILFGGKLFFGPEKIQVISTFFIILVPISLFLITQYSLEMILNLHLNFLLLVVVLIATLILFWINALCDPGIVTKLPNQPKVSSLDIQTVEFRNKSYPLKYCLVCKFHRPLRAHHCKVCDLCIEDLDHHCPWLGTCIGRRNRGNFIWFLISLTVLCCSIFSTSLSELRFTINNQDNGFLGVTTNIFFLIYSGLLGLFVVVLLIVQLLMISRGLTTLEFLKNYWKGMINPYNQGCLKNYWECLTMDRNSRTISIEQLKMLHPNIELSTTSSVLDISTTNQSLSSNLV